MNIDHDPILNTFIKTRDLTPNSKRQYIQALKAYSLFHEKTPSQLLSEAETEEDEGVRLKNRKIKERLVSYHYHLKSQEMAERSIQTYMTIIKSFYLEFNIQIPRLRFKYRSDKNPILDDILTKEKINEALKHCNLKYRAIILLMLSSGMGTAELRSLKTESFYKARNDDNIGVWQVKRSKTGMPYITFSTPESMDAITDYLQHKPPGMEFLFSDNQNILSQQTIGKYFRLINDKLEWGWRGHSRQFTPHKLRKYFATTLYKHGMPQLTIDWLLGHRIDRVTEAYFKADIQSLKEEYIKLIPDLSIGETTIHTIESEGYKKIVKELERKDEELAAVHKELKGIKEALKKTEVLYEAMEDPDKISKIVKK